MTTFQTLAMTFATCVTFHLGCGTGDELNFGPSDGEQAGGGNPGAVEPTGGAGGGGAGEPAGGVGGGGARANDCTEGECDVGFTCAPPPPPGWSGPAALWAGGPEAPVCPDNRRLDGGLDVLATPAACSACQCSAPTGMTCGAVTNTTHSVPNCQGAPLAVTIPPGQCVNQTASVASMDLGPIVPVGGACQPSGGVATLTPPSFGTQASLCLYEEPSRSGDAENQCIPDMMSSYQHTNCVFAAGDLTCPDGSYTSKTTIYTSLNDSRACSACSCGSPSGGSCSASTNLFTQPGCGSGYLATYPNNDYCQPLGGPFAVKSFNIDVSIGTSGSWCGAAGGQSTGSVELGDPVTVCCVP